MGVRTPAALTRHDWSVPSNDNIVIRDNQSESRLEVLVDDEVVGHLRYRVDGPTLVAVHTEVDDAYTRRGLATKLVRNLIARAHEAERAIRPDCPFVAAYIKQHPEET